MPFVALAVGSVVGGIISAKASSKAAKTQSEAALKASQQTTAASNTASAAQAQSSQDQLALQRQIYEEQKNRNQPWADAGSVALKQLQDPNLTATWDKQFDPNTVQMDPAFQRRLDAGNKAIQRQMSARGDANGSIALKAMTRFNQDYTSEEYGSAYNRAQQAYQQAYQQYNDNQSRKLNPLMAIAGFGQNANSALNTMGSNFGQNANNISQTGTSNINGINLGSVAASNEYASQGANARASGYIGSANAANQAVGGVTGAVSLGLLGRGDKAAAYEDALANAGWTRD